MNIFGHLRVWLAFLVLLVLAMPVAMPADRIAARIYEEARWAQEAFGQERMDRVTRRANAGWRAVVLETGLRDAIHSKPQAEAVTGVGRSIAGAKQGMYDSTKGYMASLTMQMYAVFMRGAILLEWLYFIGVFLVAAIVDGYARRQIKLTTGGLASPVKFSWATHTMIAVALSPIVYILMPVSVSPLFMPWWALVVALPLSLAIANGVRVQ